MGITCSEIKRAAAQVFAQGHDVQTPFYNRVKSSRELLAKFSGLAKDAGLVYFISAPLGSGKSFFIDQATGSLLKKQERQRPLWAKGITPQEIKAFKGDLLFVDDTDIKSTWDQLSNVMEVVHHHVEETGRNAIIIGDYCLRNPDLVGRFPKTGYLREFEPLNRDFLAGVLDQRISLYLKKKNGEGIVSDDLFDVLTPPGLANVATFRTVLTILAALADRLPHTSREARLDLELALDWVQDFDPLFTSQRQHDFLNRFLDLLLVQHPNGSGLNEGLAEDPLFSLGQSLGFGDLGEFRDEIIDPFCKIGLLVSNGTPYLHDKKRFVQYPEPYLPSIQSLLLAKL